MNENPQFTLGDLLIDRQHADLFASLRQIESLCEHRINDEKVIDQLTRISDQMRQHFISEEALMRRLSVPADEMAAHQAEHFRILEELAMIHFNIMQGRLNWVSEAFRQLSDWIAGHVVEYDLPLHDYIVKASPQ